MSLSWSMPATPPLRLRSSITREGLVLPVRVNQPGAVSPTRKQARGPRWRRTSQGFYVPSTVDVDDPEQRIAEASVLIPPDCALTGWGALCWLRARWFRGTTASGEHRPLTIAITTHDIREQEGIEVSGEGLNPDLVIVVDGLAITRPVYSVSFEMRYADSDREAAQILSMAAYNDLVSIEEQLAFMTPGQNGWTGIPQGRRAIPLAGENFWSPREHGMCLTWDIDAGHPRPRANQPVFDRTGRHVGTPDLIDVEAGVFGQYNGAVHLDGGQASQDIRSDSAFRRVGLEGVTMVAADLADTRHFIQRLHEAYARARAKPSSDRAWTTDPPAWWTSTTTVAARRALDEDQAARLLAYRRAG